MMIRTISIPLSTALSAGLAALLVAVTPGALPAQSSPLAMHSLDSSAPGGGGGEEAPVSSALARGRYAVVIDLDENRLFFKQGKVTLWSAPIGTGTGLRLQADDKSWDFATPRGTFHVQYKEENPVWIAPDWYFIENGLPVPPANDKKRYFPGGLGSAAVFIGHDLAIHGTDKPELLGQQVSHGCIRLSDKDALRLFHNVQVGTEVVIVGGEKQSASARTVTPEEIQKSKAASSFNPAKPKPRPKDPVLERWKELESEALFSELKDELWKDAKETRWTEVAGLLLKRGLDENDDAALRALLLGIADVPTSAVEREYRTFLADAFSRGALRTLEVMGQISPRYRDRVAAAIVEASIGLYPGDLDEPAVPWPTRRIPRDAVELEGKRGWSSLARAEQRFRGQDERGRI